MWLLNQFGTQDCLTEEVGLGLVNFVELSIYVFCLSFPFSLCCIQTVRQTPPLPQERTKAGWFIFKPTQLGDCMEGAEGNSNRRGLKM